MGAVEQPSSLGQNSSSDSWQKSTTSAMATARNVNHSIVASNSTFSCAFDAPNVLLITIGSAAALMNGLLLLVLYNERKKFFRTRVSYLVANLAVADCFTGLMLVAVMVCNLAQKPRALRGYEFLFLCASIQVSFFTLILMSLDRLIVAVMPMTWSRFLTTRNTIIGIVLAWTLGIFESVMNKYEITDRRFVLFLILEIAAVMFILIHVVIFLVLRRQRRNFSQSGSSAELSTIMDLSLQACHAQITSVVLTLMMVLVITYTPYIVYSNILLARDGTSMRIRIYETGFRYTQAFSYLNYAANPIVYAWRLRVYRKALCSLILKMTI
ncbi:cannabinoid receptor 1-like isoform X2 [Dendronephthya gigantea]|uniref:cannabinoid receptor 1-like isoform X2 n=1 Tax=Dendronephthya gigantea TaxID=151771 RepID=UPI00106CB1E9|nr:cannabinoid receptor 1-like isoform X2 [Dendronephthya gigantea]